ncbi:MAG: hypothetical protein IT405_01405 [Candidatus Yanofskybacteria bacterium]|nr:hypothetical protein [Candidatus Yanofskybacteria bacterium]
MTALNETEDFLYSPYIAAIADKDDAQLRAFAEKFAAQNESDRTFLTSPETALAIKRLVEEGVIPEEYAIATAKIVAFVVLREVPLSSVPQLLERIGLASPQAQNAATAITQLLQPLIAARAAAETPEQLPELPPMTTKIPPAPQQHSSNTPPRNIIDLRNKPAA